MKKNLWYPIAIALLVLSASCKKNSDTPGPAPVVTTGYYILNEGLFSHNNTTLTYYSLKDSTATTDFFANVNGSGLGDTGNDILIYGGKLYIVMNESSYIEVADASTATNLKKIDMKDSTSAPSLPRNIVGYKNKVLVTAYDGTVSVIDTSSLQIEKTIYVGSTPEQLTIVGDQLYVANSGGLNYPDYDSTVSVIDLNSYTETKKIVVGVNPARLTSDNTGNVFVITNGDYGTILPQLVSINTNTNTVTKSVQLNVNTVRYYNNKLYVFNSYGVGVTVALVDPATLAITQANFVTDGTVVTTPYGLNVDPSNGDVFITDAKDYSSSGEVFCFDKTGKKKFSFSVTPGINPDNVVIIKK